MKRNYEIQLTFDDQHCALLPMPFCERKLAPRGCLRMRLSLMILSRYLAYTLHHTCVTCYAHCWYQ